MWALEKQITSSMNIFIGFYDNIVVFHDLWSQRMLRMMGIYLVWYAYIKHSAYTLWCGDHKAIHYHKSIHISLVVFHGCTSHPFPVKKLTSSPRVLLNHQPGCALPPQDIPGASCSIGVEMAAQFSRAAELGCSWGTYTPVSYHG